jgi:predicted transcriptional regulator
MLTEEQKKAVTALTSSGWSSARIAKSLGLTHEYVKRYLMEPPYVEPVA